VYVLSQTQALSTKESSRDIAGKTTTIFTSRCHISDERFARKCLLRTITRRTLAIS